MRALWLALTLLTTVACTSGRRYEEGFVRKEKLNMFLFDFQRDEVRESWAVFCEPFVAAGTTSGGNFYVNALGGLLNTVNIPGVSMLIIYPFQYHDQPEATRHVFGIGSGEGDFRISLLWGFLSLGRHWNIFWMKGFWWHHRDPMYVAPSDASKSAYEAITVQSEP